MCAGKPQSGFPPAQEAPRSFFFVVVCVGCVLSLMLGCARSSMKRSCFHTFHPMNARKTAFFAFLLLLASGTLPFVRGTGTVKPQEHVFV